MNSLADQQQQLRAAVVDAAPAPGLLHAGGREEPLLHIYQHAYRARLIDALRDNHGVLPLAMGDDAFEALASAYVQAHPSRTPSIRWFGAQLAQFMREQPDLVPHPAFIDLARMEWALRAAFDALDAPPLQREALAALAPAAWPEWVPQLHPSVQLLELQWRIEPAWRALQNTDGEPELPEPRAEDHLLLVWRPALETRWRSAHSELEAALLRDVKAGANFAALCERAAEHSDDAALAAAQALARWVDEGLLSI